MFSGINFLPDDAEKREQKKKLDQKNKSGDFEFSEPAGKKEKKDLKNKLTKTKEVRSNEDLEIEKKRGGWWRKMLSFKNQIKKGGKKVKVDKGQVGGADLLKNSFGELIGSDKESGNHLEVENKFVRKDKTKKNTEVLLGSKIETTKSKSITKKQDILDDVNFDINLIPSDRKKFGFMAKLGVLMVILLPVLSVIFWSADNITQQNNKREMSLELIEQKIKETDGGISKIESMTQSAQEWHQKVGVAEFLIRRHQWWSKFFESLEQTTPIDVYYNSLQIDKNNEVTVEGVAKDYRALAQAILVYDSFEYFMSGFDIEGITFLVEKDQEGEEGVSGEGEIGFILRFKISSDFLLAGGVDK